MAAYPRRVKYRGDMVTVVSFYADDGMHFEIPRENFVNCISDKEEESYKVHAFANAFIENRLDEYCDSLNYGKPDFKESSCSE